MAVRETFAFSAALRDSMIASMSNAEFLSLSLSGSSLTPDQCIPLPNPIQPIVELVSPFSVFNESGSDRVVRLHRIAVNDISPFYQSSAAPPYTFAYRITATSGGEDATVVKHDTDNADIPAEVAIKFAVPEITVSGLPIRKSVIPALQATGSMLGRVAGVGGNQRDQLSPSSLYSIHEGELQTIVLREGEGIALRAPNDGDASLTYGMGISEVLMEFSIGGENYTASAALMPYTSQNLFCLFNGVGSGVVVNVGAIRFTNLHASITSSMNWDVVTVSASRGGDDFTAQPMDTNNALLPDANLKIKRNAIVSLAGPDQHLFPAKRGKGDSILRRGPGVMQGFIPNQGNTILTRFGADFGGFSDFIRDVSAGASKDVDAQSEFVVRAGEGIALLPICSINAFNRFADWEIHAMLSVEDISTPEPPAPSSGGGSYMRRR